MLRLVSALLAICAAAAVAAGCSPNGGGAASGDFHPKHAGALTVVTQQVPAPGFWEGTAAKPTGGFEFGLADKLRQRFGLDHVRIVTRPFSEIVAGDLGGADMAIALITPTKDRDKVLDFSDPYITAPPGVLTRTGTEVPDLKTARGLRWVTQDSTTLQKIVQEQIDPTKPQAEVGSIADKVNAVESGKADAALFDFPLAASLADRSGGRLHVAAKMFDSETIAVALPQGSDNNEAVSAAMRAFNSDGTIEDLSTRWLGPQAAGSGKDVPVIRTSRG